MHDFLFRHRSRRFWNKPDEGSMGGAAPGGTDGPSAVDAQVAPPEVLGAAGPFDDASLEAFVAGVVSGKADATPAAPEVDADGNPIEAAPEVDADGNPIEPAPAPTEEEEHAAWLAEQPQDVQDRFAKLAAKAPAPAKPAAKPEGEEKPAKPAEVKAKTLTANPLDAVESLDDLQAIVAKAKHDRNWALQNWEGGEIDDGNGNVTQVDGATVRAFYAKQLALLEDHAPAREQFLRAEEAHLERAAAAYPYFRNNESPEYQTVQRVLQFLPELKQRLPDSRLFAADWLAGRAARLAKEKASPGAGTPGKPAPGAKKISPSVTTPAPALAERKPASQPNPGAARKPTSSPRSEAAVAAVLKTGGTVEDIATFLKTVG